MADKTGKFSLVFLFNILLAALTGNFLLIIPKVDRGITEFSCSKNQSLASEVSFTHCYEALLNQNVKSIEFKVFIKILIRNMDGIDSRFSPFL